MLKAKFTKPQGLVNFINGFDSLPNFNTTIIYSFKTIIELIIIDAVCNFVYPLN